MKLKAGNKIFAIQIEKEEVATSEKETITLIRTVSVDNKPTSLADFPIDNIDPNYNVTFSIVVDGVQEVEEEVTRVKDTDISVLVDVFGNVYKRVIIE